MNAEGLGNAPWRWENDGPRPDYYEGPLLILKNGDGKELCDFGRELEYYPMAGTEPSAEVRNFIILARNAWDVMVRRGWGVHRRHPEGWVVSGMLGECHLSDAHLAFAEWVSMTIFQDPFTALVEADRWYKENVETKA